MTTFSSKILAITLIIFGEIFSVYSEMVAAKSYSTPEAAFGGIFSKNLAILTIAGAMLIAGYMIGYSAFQNIWIVSVISVTSILIIEPGLTYFVFRELPGRGATIGFLFGFFGFLATFLDEA